ncbi:hypothetical protein [Pseudoroseomonas cervicalis]|nr:hypothetical protein [Pseudoroseomonas cervicalis]MDQ1078721.1 hypothetical protein [Pseudoroseomonas cervicalis]
MWVRFVLAAAGAVTTLLIAEDAPNFAVVQGIVAIGLIAAVIFVIAALRR